MNIGEKIRKVREVKGFPQEYIATNLNISPQAYGKMERGETKLDMDRLQKVADILEIELLELMQVNEKQNALVTNFNTHQEGNYNFYTESAKTIELLEKTVTQQESEITFLRKEIEKLTDTLGSK